MEAINETVKVIIDGVRYWIRMKEAQSQFEMLREQITKNMASNQVASSDYTNDDPFISSEDDSDQEIYKSKGEESLY